MLETKTQLFTTFVVLTLVGCASPDNVIFVTTANVGIDADTTPPNITIGYGRYEGYYGPIYDSGALPPVVARLESNLSVFSPELRQTYATGNAAQIVTDDKPSKPKPRPLSGTKRVAFFGTSSVVGLKVAFNANGPESLSLGYKRKELSFIPIMKTPESDQYGSVLASIGMNVATPNLTNTKLGISQFFATGIAAENLAYSEASIKDFFKLQAVEALSGSIVKFEKDKNTAVLDQCEQDSTCRAKLEIWLSDKNVAKCTIIADLMFSPNCTGLRKEAAAQPDFQMN